jgi:hypothetical protein
MANPSRARKQAVVRFAAKPADQPALLGLNHRSLAVAALI